MSLLIEQAAWQTDRLTAPQKFVAVALATRADTLGATHISEQRLAELTGYTPRTVRNAIRQLFRKQVLSPASPSGRPDHYQFTAEFMGARCRI